MGLSASQAKLLSITSRLSANELRAQEITRQKTALTNQTVEANDRYIKALNQKTLTYQGYDLDGNQVSMALTGSQLSTYGPLKNQYGLINSSGRILVSELDAANFESSKNINEFLAKYGIEQIDTGETIILKNPNYDAEYDAWEKDHQDWVENYPKVEDFTSVVIDTDNKIYNAVKSSGGCFSLGMSGLNCYMHALSDLIGAGEHTTSSGETYTITSEGSWSWNSAKHDVEDFEEITEMLKNGHCSGDVIEGSLVIDGVEYPNMAKEEVTYNGITKEVAVGGVISDPEMSLYQRAIDLLWEVHNDYQEGSGTGGDANEASFAKFLYFVEHDLKQANKQTIFDEDGYNKAIEEYRKEPVLTAQETFEEKVYEYTDSDKAQWYVNLWHRMNGSSQYKNGELTTNDATLGTTTINYKPVGRQYEVLEDGLMNSASWLQHALENGTITLEKVNFSDQPESGTGLKNASWTSIIYTSVLEIHEKESSVDKSKAEAEFEQTQKIIEAKDKQFDNILKLLDTEHNALQTEYDSVKSVISKNIDRTLKIYSA